MPRHTRTIYSRRQRMAPGQYDTPLADFLDRLPDYFNQYQQNQLAIDRQKLADKRYQDSVERQDRIEKKNDYQRALSATSKYDYSAKQKVAKTFGMDTEAAAFGELSDNLNTNLSDIRSKVSDIQNLGTDATFYDYDKIKISPEQIEILKERDPFAYDTLVKSKTKYDNQRSTMMRTMSSQDATELKRANVNIGLIEKEMIKVAQKMPNIDTDNKTSMEILDALRATGANPTSELKQLRDQLSFYEGTVNSLNEKYRIKPLEVETGEVEGQDISTIATSIARPDYDPSVDSIEKAIGTPEGALDANERVENLYALATAPEDSQEYQTAKSKTEAFEELKQSEPIVPSLRERMSARGVSGERGFKIDPDAKIFKEIPSFKKQSPEYYQRLLPQLRANMSTFGRAVSLNPTEANKILEAQDKIIDDLRLAINSMPDTKQYGNLKQQYRNALKDYVQSYNYQGGFKGRRQYGFRYQVPQEPQGQLVQEGTPALQRILNVVSAQQPSVPIE